MASPSRRKSFRIVSSEPFAIVPLWVFKADLTPSEFKVLSALYSFRDKNANTTWPSVESLADRIGMKDKTQISKITKRLCEKGHLHKKKRGFTGGITYTFNVPETPNDPDEPPKLGETTSLDESTIPKLDKSTSSILDKTTKCNELTIEQTNELTIKNKSDLEYLNEAFEVFYESGITKRGDKKKTFKAFERKSRNQDPMEFANMLSQDISKRLSLNQFGFDKIYPATYLNGERWNDDLPKTNEANGHASNRKYTPQRPSVVSAATDAF